MKVGIFGTGLMGQPMALRLFSAQIPVIAYNRTPSKLKALQQQGIEITTNPSEAIMAADCLILILTNTPAIEDVIFSDESFSLLENRSVIQMGTISPDESRLIGDRVVSLGGEYLEAPVLGSIPQAKAGELLVMVGSTEKQFQKWLPLLQNFGSKPRLIGEVGAAAALKLALNQLIASLTSAFALSLGFVQNQGVDVEQFMEILRESALYAPTFDKKVKRMCENNYANPNFPSKHLLKDINLFLNQAKTNGLNITSLEGVSQVVVQAIEMGFADDDYSSLYSAITSKR